MLKKIPTALLAILLLEGCQSVLIQPTPEEVKALASFDLPVRPASSEAVVYIVQGTPSGFLSGEKLAYKLVRRFQIGNSEIREAAPGEYLVFKMKPGSYDIRVEAVCDRTKNSVLPEPGSVITPDTPGFIKYVSLLSQMPTGSVQTFEAGKVYVYRTSPSCYLNRYDASTSLLLRMRLVEDTEQAKLYVMKAKPAMN